MFMLGLQEKRTRHKESELFERIAGQLILSHNHQIAFRENQQMLWKDEQQKMILLIQKIVRIISSVE